MSFGVFDTHLGAQGMEGISELQNFLAPLFLQCGPSHLLVLTVSNRVILFLYRIHLKLSSGFNPIYSRLLYGNFLPVSVVSPRTSPIANHVLKEIVIMFYRLVSQVFISWWLM
jgi:hypothetical protein